MKVSFRKQWAVRSLLAAGLLTMGVGHGEVLLSEFQASNLRTLDDEDGNSEDWIEIHNAGDLPVDLAGWSLTDDAGQLKKWQFPSTNIAPGQYLIVFASGKDRRVPGRPLHTDFRLSASGEFLALVKADGRTLATAYSPAYPPQAEDISYGLPLLPTSLALVGPRAPGRLLVPRGDDLGTNWVRPDFDDADWTPVVTGVGFNVPGGLVGSDIEGAMRGLNPTAYVRIPFVVTNLAALDRLTLNIRYNDGFAAYLNGFPIAQRNAPVTAPGGALANSVSDWSFAGQQGFNNWYYGFYDHAADADGRYDAGRDFVSSNPQWSWNGGAWVLGPANPPWDAVTQGGWFSNGENSGGAHWVIRRWVCEAPGTFVCQVAFAKENPACGNGATLRVFVNGDEQYQATVPFNDTTGVRTNLTLTDLAAGDTLDFALDPLGTDGQRTDHCDELTFSVVIDQVPSEGAAWNSTADTARTPEETLVSEPFDLTRYRDVLVSGTNVLAIQGLNIGADDADFLLAPELAGGCLGLSRDQHVYFPEPTPGEENGSGTAALGPIVSQVEHEPAVPADSEDLIVRARVTSSFRPVGTVTLRYRVMYAGEASIPMRDDGAHEDGDAGDGIYAARIPAAAANPGQMIRYAIIAADDQARVSRLPAYTDPLRSPQYRGTIVRDPSLEATQLPVLHWFIQNPSAANSDTRASGSLFFDGEFYDNVGATIHGQSTRGFPKRSYDLDFNPGYKFRWSDDAPRVDDLNLLTTWADKSHMRNVLAHETYRDAGALSHFAFAVRVQQNGAFFSVANLVENGDDNFLKRLGLDPRGALYKMYNSADSVAGNEKKTRKNEGTADLAALIQGMSQAGATAREAFLYDNLDVPQMVDFLAAKIITADTDCCHKNYYLYRDSDGTREWMAMPWDVDLSFGRVWTSAYAYYDEQIYTNQSIFIGSGNKVFSPLYNTSATRQMFLRRLRTLMDDLLQPLATPATNDFYRIKSRALRDRIAPDAALDLAKWGTWGTRETITQAVDRIWNQFLPGRRVYLFRTLSVTNGGEIPLPQPADAVVEIGSLEYRPASGNPAEEWLSITNANAYAVDLSAWQLDGAVRFTFKPGTVLPARAALFVSPDVRAFRARSASPRGGERRLVLGPYEGDLSARGETLTLTDNRGRPVHTRTYAGSPSLAQQSLRITEIMYHPAPMTGHPDLDDSEFEFIELRNTGSVALDLRGVRFTEGIQFDFAAGSITTLEPGARVLVVRNAEAFSLRYGTGLPVAGEYTGLLDNSGERLRLEDGYGEKILEFTYDDLWSPITDGHGFSLAIADDTVEWTRWNDRESWRPNGILDGTPGLVDPPLPTLPPVVINEVLTHSTGPQEDAIELHNPTDAPIDVGGWFLTDTFSAPEKYRLPSPTIIPALGFAVFTETHFNPTPGQPPSFALGADGDDVWIFSADEAGRLTGYVQGFDFEATASGVSLGRHTNSVGDVDYPPLASVTLGDPNAAPRAGPVVISEIMYHPAATGIANQPASFIELANISTTNVPLSDPAMPDSPWRLRNGVAFAFPPGAALPSGRRLLVVGFDPVADAEARASFISLYAIPPDVPLHGPWQGRLANDEDTIELAQPAVAQGQDTPYALVDKVHYLDLAPWPTGADGSGASLQRRTLASYGNEPTNWFASTPTAGAVNQPNALPIVRLTAPSQSAVLHWPADVLLSASAEDSDGRIVRVDFFNHDQKLAQLTEVPYTFVWTNPPPGTHLLRAVAVDDRLGATTSDATEVTVIAPPPVVRMVAPADGAVLLAGSTITVAAEAEPAAGQIDRVRLYAGPTVLAELLAPPFEFSWSVVPAGVYELQAVALDSFGLASTSAVARVGLSTGTVAASTVVPTGAQWKYLDDGSAPDPAWTTLGFDDSGWRSGTAELGYGDAGESRPEATLIRFGPDSANKHITSYFRHPFTVTNVFSYRDLTVGLLRDDGAVVYLNGIEVYRNNLPEGPIHSRTLASYAVSGAEESAIFTQSVTPARLREGPNVLAVEVHQASAGSTDLSFDLALSGTRVFLAPILLAQPQSQAVARGATATFTGWAGGTEPLAFQWRFNQVPILAATNATLTLSDVQLSQAGAYQLVVRNALGTAVSEPASLTLTNRPPVTVADGILVPQGQTAFLSTSTLTSNDSDPDGDAVRLVSVSPFSEQGGSVAVVSGQVRYQPPAAFQGADRFTYAVADPQGLSSTGNVAVFVYAGPLPALNRLTVIPESTVLRIRYSGGPGQPFEWQRSPDLRHWEVLTSGVIPPHSFVEWAEPLSTAGRACYRVVQR
ncbi:MAG TPA: lamin tail domain-containing protein [Candidatus Paceibacterota bacterium]|nr:lamin tail domain-containing protein [Candidatus Paceibacterota bacterium]HRZ54073.1 lamin tail domain-containing protein [Candidatus Paceibacterota bacterium]